MKAVGCINDLNDLMPEQPESLYLYNKKNKKVQRVRHKKVWNDLTARAMIGGRLQGITREDAVQFARDNGIHRPDAIIRDVAASLKQFRSIATKYGVSDEWTGRVETTIIGHLKAWGEW